jgi:hypothetical protein
MFFHGVMATQRVVVTFETREIAAGPFQIFNATVVKQYGRSMVLDLGREAELPEAWIREMFGENVTVELDVLNGSLSGTSLAQGVLNGSLSGTSLAQSVLNGSLSGTSLAQGVTHVASTTGVTTPMVTTLMATVAATNVTMFSDSIAVLDECIIVLIVLGAMTAIVLILMACRKRKCHFYKILSQNPT